MSCRVELGHTRKRIPLCVGLPRLLVGGLAGCLRCVGMRSSQPQQGHTKIGVMTAPTRPHLTADACRGVSESSLLNPSFLSLLYIEPIWFLWWSRGLVFTPLAVQAPPSHTRLFRVRNAPPKVIISGDRLVPNTCFHTPTLTHCYPVHCCCLFMCCRLAIRRVQTTRRPRRRRAGGQEGPFDVA